MTLEVVMSDEPSSTDSSPSVAETRELWDRKAAFWDDRFGEGNEFHRLLIEPAALRLLDIQPDETVLDIACGNGALSRRLAGLGAQVLAFDFSSVFLERARARSTALADRITYQMVDATDRDQLLALGEGRFDAAVAGMALMDMPAIDALAEALTRLLRPDGRLVFTVAHPCFNSNAVAMQAETEEREGRLGVAHAMKITGYLDVPPGLGAGMPGESNPHYYFHRPLSQLLAPFFSSGFVLDGLEEPAFPQIDDARALSWASYHQIPPILAVRLRRQGPFGAERQG